MDGVIIAIAIVLFIAVSSIKIVSQTDAYVIERLGKYNHTMTAGINLKIPIIDRIVRKVKLKEQVGDFPPQPVITKDNVSIQVDTAIYYKIFDPKLFTYGVENAVEAMALLTATTMRNMAVWTLMILLHQETRLTVRHLLPLMRQLTSGVLKLHVLRLRTLFLRVIFRMLWRNR